MAKIDDMFDTIEKQTQEYKHLANAIVALSNDIEKLARAPKLPEPKPDPRIGEIMIELSELREIVKRAAMAPHPKEDNGYTTFGYVIVFFLIFLGVVGADYIACNLAKDKPGIDYAERVLYNQCYEKYGSMIGLFDTEEEAQKIMHNQWQYEKEQIMKEQIVQ